MFYYFIYMFYTFSAMKVYLDTKTIQKMGRVALNDALLRNAGLQEGDSVDIFFDASSKHIIIQKAEAVLETTGASENAKKQEVK